VIYLIGSLRNDAIPEIANMLRADGHEVFDDWFSAGPIADDSWQSHQKRKSVSYKEALQGYAARNVFNFDLMHLKRSDTAVLVMPAGKSGHLEFGWCLGKGKRGYVLFDQEPERWDVMYQFADGVFFNVPDLLQELNAKSYEEMHLAQRQHHQGFNGSIHKREAVYPSNLPGDHAQPPSAGGAGGAVYVGPPLRAWGLGGDDATGS
jgi:hypothetical protein